VLLSEGMGHGIVLGGMRHDVVLGEMGRDIVSGGRVYYRGSYSVLFQEE
jgi:hypothetical protein